jgi:hypothetical protein
MGRTVTSCWEVRSHPALAVKALLCISTQIYRPPWEWEGTLGNLRLGRAAASVFCYTCPSYRLCFPALLLKGCKSMAPRLVLCTPCIVLACLSHTSTCSCCLLLLQFSSPWTKFEKYFTVFWSFFVSARWYRDTVYTHTLSIPKYLSLSFPEKQHWQNIY